MTSQAWAWQADSQGKAGHGSSSRKGVGSDFETDLGLRPRLGPLLNTHSTLNQESAPGGAGSDFRPSMGQIVKRRNVELGRVLKVKKWFRDAGRGGCPRGRVPRGRGLARIGSK